VPREDGNRQTNVQSDAAGRFSLRGQRGPNLTVLVSKEGYYPRSGGARYGPINNPDFVPDQNDPIVFRLRKKGNPEPLIHMKQNFRISRDGTPLAIDLIDGKSTAGENGNFVVRCWTSDAGKHSGERYDWRCVISVPDGGVATTRDEFPFQAPETGYRPNLEINMPVDYTNWSSQVDLKLYYHLPDGRYGKMEFSIVAFGQHFCMIDSLLNPSGSRNLEPPN